MAAYIFQQIANKGKADGITPNVTSDARDWYRSAAQTVGSVNTSRMMTDKANIRASIQMQDIGKMFMFFYDPKMKEVLPFYDKFPLIFPIGFAEGGFMGINLHYLPPVLRAKLMDALYATANSNKYNDKTKLKISYDILNSASRFKYFQPCLKRYLWDHVQSNFLNVEVKNWDTALLLPTERFSKASKQAVWKDSLSKVR